MVQRGWEVLFLSTDGQEEVPREVCVVHHNVKSLCPRAAQACPCGAQRVLCRAPDGLLARGSAWAGRVCMVSAGEIPISMVYICHKHLSQTAETQL